MDVQEKLTFDVLSLQPNLLMAALNAAANSILITDELTPGAPIIYCNRAFEALTGYTSADVMGRNCRFLQGKNTTQDARIIIQETIANGSDCLVELKNYRKDGSWFWNELYLSPIRNIHGIVTNYVGIQNDITARKQQVLTLKTQLDQSRKLQNLKDEFISVASHELKTPLTTLKASLQLLAKLKNDLASRMLPLLIDQSVKSMEKISVVVNDLLTFTRVNEGQLQLSKSLFKIADMVNSHCDYIADGGKYEVIIQDDTDLEIHADEGRLGQVIVNLVNNAMRYSPKSMVIRVLIERERGGAKVSVSDDGPGIAAERIPHLFERYYRASHAGTHHSGLGLGLYISSEIVKRHEGQIGVNTELGVGSTFWFTLPQDFAANSKLSQKLTVAG
ncbi:sensor histidine kinase [Mucilaginibacter glaciei]|uniref:histidine kinase n=1 Tax=Mucilaginibacter glaciei TaxID=2772109 RepID=A0A926NQ12_9SPHI|nr:HAMP domain-containing sensor histidine kinase [Mucilaginibacter glaciei]MBD1392572.1 PAS domain-containing protein [Mucilaginibacter glaciei]